MVRSREGHRAPPRAQRTGAPRDAHARLNNPAASDDFVAARMRSSHRRARTRKRRARGRSIVSKMTVSVVEISPNDAARRDAICPPPLAVWSAETVVIAFRALQRVL